MNLYVDETRRRSRWARIAPLLATRKAAADPADLVAYISTMFTLRPGDLIATGTPGGVGHARDPKRYLSPGATLTTTITGLGQCVNVCRSEVANGT